MTPDLSYELEGEREEDGHKIINGMSKIYIYIYIYIYQVENRTKYC